MVSVVCLHHAIIPVKKHRVVYSFSNIYSPEFKIRIKKKLHYFHQTKALLVLVIILTKHSIFRNHQLLVLTANRSDSNWSILGKV